MKVTNVIFATLFVAANLFVACDSSMYDAPVAEQAKSMELSVTDGSDAYYWYKGEKHYLTPDYSSSFIVYDGSANAVASHDILLGGDYGPSQSKVATRASENKNKKWAVVNGCVLQSRSGQDNPGISYQSPVYKSAETGNTVRLSNLIHLKLKSEGDTTVMYEQMRKYGLSVYSQNKFMPLWYSLSCDTNTYGTALEVCNLLHDTEMFAVVEPDFMADMKQALTAFQAPNDTYYNNQWYLHGTYSINWAEASTIATGENVEIGLIDTGVECSHPDFDMSRVRHTYDAYGGSIYGASIYGEHGTECAGIIAAIKNNNLGIAGICSKVYVSSYSDPLEPRPNITQDLASDLYVAVTSSDIVSCSWGGEDLVSSEISEAIDYFAAWGRNNKGTVVVFSTGNNFGDVVFPANSNPNILAVGASDANGRKADFSNYGPEVDVVAPGVNIQTLGFNGNSTYGYTTDSGTSMSCPQVAAIAALILSINPDLKAIEVNDIIEQTARKVGGYSYATTSGRPNGTWNNYMGYGLVDATAAVKAAQATLNE